MRPTRREILAAMGLVGAAASVGCVDPLIEGSHRTPDPEGPWEGVGEADDAAFSMGVQSGDPLPDGVILWTRYDGAVAVEVIVAAWVDGAWVAEAAVPVTVVDRFVHHDLTGRPADQPLAFQFRDALGRLSRVGYSRTAMSPDTAGLVRIGATSCLSQNHGDFPCLPHTVARGPLDFWCWLGDAAYFDGRDQRHEYDTLWRQNLTTSGFRSVLATMASIYTWDDHEVGNNWTHEPSFPQDVIQTAYDAFFANTPIRRHPTEARQIWRKLRFGRTAEVFVLDCRGERDEQNDVYMSDEQLQWLIEGLVASPCTWKIVLNSVPFANLLGPYDADVGTADRWEGYPEQRQPLLEAASSLDGVLFVSGDVHQGGLIQAEAEGMGSNVLDFLVGPSGSFLNPLGDLLRGNPGLLWSRSVWSAARIELSPFGLARLIAVGEEDQTWMEALIDTKGNLLSFEEIEPEPS